MSANEPPSELEPVKEACVGETLWVSNYNSFAQVRFVGTTDFSKGIWVGLELPTPTGKNDGSVKGTRYFPCQPQHGIFVRASACSRQLSGGNREEGSNAAARPQPEPEPERQPELLPPAPPPAEEAAPSRSAAPGPGIQVHGSLTGADSDMSDSSDDEDAADEAAPRPLSPPLNLAAGPDDDSEGELEVCIEAAPTERAAPAPQSQHAAMEAYLAAMEARAAPGLALVSAMESSVNAVISSEPEYQAAAGTGTGAARSADAFGSVGSGPEGSVEVVTVADATEPDVFGIAYKPFKKTIVAGAPAGPPKKTFEDEDEFERDLQQSAVAGPSVPGPAGCVDDEFDFEVDHPALDASELRRTLEAAAEEVLAAGAAPARPAPIETGGDASPDAEGTVEKGADEGNYDAYGDAKDALRAIVDIYGCGLGDQEIVIMNSLGTDAVIGHATTPKNPPVALGGSIVPGTGTVSKSKSKRKSNSNTVRSKIEREKIIEEDEEDYEQREREQEEAKAEEERKAQLEVAMLESEWQGLAKSPEKPQRRKSFNGKNSPVARTASSPRLSNPMMGSPTGRGAFPPSPGSVDDSKYAPNGYDSLLSFFRTRNLTQYHSEIITSTESKGSWLLGGNAKLNFDGSEDELKFCFSVAHVNYDPVLHREHFTALKSIYKFFVPTAVPASPSPAGSRASRNRDVGMVGSHWGNIGFQGLDPCTDINRSMKMLSVLQVLHLIQDFPTFARCLHKLSQHSVPGEKMDLTWPFFCVSIGFTRDALQTLRTNCLNKRCNKFKSVMIALNEFYRACFFTFAKDVLEKPSVHHAHHIASLRSAVENTPMNVLKGYKTFIKKKCAKDGNLSPQDALSSLFNGHPCGVACGGDSDLFPSGSSPEKFLEAENLEFAGLDEIKDNLDNRSPSPDKMGGGLFSMGRKKGYET